jgi:chaperonin cofactor prefoldin
VTSINNNPNNIFFQQQRQVEQQKLFVGKEGKEKLDDLFKDFKADVKDFQAKRNELESKRSDLIDEVSDLKAQLRQKLQSGDVDGTKELEEKIESLKAEIGDIQKEIFMDSFRFYDLQQNFQNELQTISKEHFEQPQINPLEQYALIFAQMFQSQFPQQGSAFQNAYSCGQNCYGNMFSGLISPNQQHMSPQMQFLQLLFNGMK